MAIHALLQQSRGYGFAGQPPMWVPPSESRPGQFRSLFFGIFGDPNDLAQILTTSIPFAFVLLRQRGFGITLGGPVVWLLVQGVLATHSRGGLVAMVATGAVIVVLMLPNRWFPYLMTGLLIGALAMCPLSAGYLDQSAHDRVVFWGMANEQFKHNLLFGMGYNMFWQVASSSAAHNAFVLCYTEIGIVGYWFWFGILALGIAGVWRGRDAVFAATDPEGRWLRLFSGMVLASVTGFLASAYFLSRTFVFPLFFLFAMMAAVPRVVEDRFAAEGEPLEAPLLDWKRDVLKINSIAVVASVFYIYYSIVLLNKAFYGG
jgi:O-antigen ligase